MQGSRSGLRVRVHLNPLPRAGTDPNLVLFPASLARVFWRIADVDRGLLLRLRQKVQGSGKVGLLLVNQGIHN